MRGHFRRAAWVGDFLIASGSCSAVGAVARDFAAVVSGACSSVQARVVRARVGIADRSGHAEGVGSCMCAVALHLDDVFPLGKRDRDLGLEAARVVVGCEFFTRHVQHPYEGVEAGAAGREAGGGRGCGDLEGVPVVGGRVAANVGRAGGVASDGPGAGDAPLRAAVTSPARDSEGVRAEMRRTGALDQDGVVTGAEGSRDLGLDAARVIVGRDLVAHGVVHPQVGVKVRAAAAEQERARRADREAVRVVVGRATEHVTECGGVAGLGVAASNRSHVHVRCLSRGQGWGVGQRANVGLQEDVRDGVVGEDPGDCAVEQRLRRLHWGESGLPGIHQCQHSRNVRTGHRGPGQDSGGSVTGVPARGDAGARGVDVDARAVVREGGAGVPGGG